MSRHPRLYLLLPAMIFILLTLPATGHTRAFLMESFADGTLHFSFQFKRANFLGENNVSTMSGTYEFSAFVPVSEKVSLLLKVPMTKLFLHEIKNLEYDENFQIVGEEDEFAFGNPYIGISQTPLPTMANIALNAGLYLPISEIKSRDVLFMGTVSDYWHPQKYKRDVLTVHLGLLKRIMADSGLYMDFEAGSDFYITFGYHQGDSNPSCRYGLGAGLDTSKFSIGLEFSGIWYPGKEGNYHVDSTHVVGLGIEYKGKLIQPALSYSRPTDQYLWDNVTGILGLRFTVRP